MTATSAVERQPGERWWSEFWMPSATPMAPETPMAMAPRTIMSRMTVATCL